MARPSDIHFSKDSSGFYVCWMSLFMVFITTLVLALALVVHSSLNLWYQDISGSMTVQIPTYDSKGKSREKYLQEDIETTLTILRSTDGITGASVLSDEQMDSLMAPWLGESVVTKELPMPKLIDVTIDANNFPDLEQVKADLAEQVPLAVLDSHRMVLNDLVKLAHGLIQIVGIVLILLMVSMALSIVFATKSGLKVHHQAISLIHMMGAGDFYITRQFANRSFWLALLGGILGLLLALPVMISISYCLNSLSDGFIISATLTQLQWGILGGVPFISAIIAYITAFKTVFSALKRNL